MFLFDYFEQVNVGWKIIEIQINENTVNGINFIFKNFHKKFEKTIDVSNH